MERERRFDSANDSGELAKAGFESLGAAPEVTGRRVVTIGNLVMVLGRSGSGKSASLRNFAPDEVAIFSVAGKRLPFKSDLPVMLNAGYQNVIDALQKGKRRCYVIDDAGYLMQFANFARAHESGYGKFTDFAVDFANLLQWAKNTDADTNVFFLMHPDTDEMGRERPKTIGRMLDEKLCVEGMFPIVIDCEARVDERGEPHHVFVTANDGRNLAKAPMGMLPAVMDNDLKAVDDAIRDFWGMAPIVDGRE